MMKKFKISIITPSYNQGKFIEETIKSVINQDYDLLEYIIIDGGSTDNTVDIIKKYEKKITYWVSEKDNGQTHAINKGFELATGDIIAWINSDDMYCEGTLRTIAEFFEKNEEANVVVGNELFMNSNGKIYVRKHPNISKWLEKHCMMSILQPSTFLRKNVLTHIGYLNEEYQMMMDAEWYTRINRQYPFQVINKDLSIFRWHSESKSSSSHNSKLYKRYIQEATFIIKFTHPYLGKIVNYFPVTVFRLHLWIGFTARFFRRMVKLELHKLNDDIF